MLFQIAPYLKVYFYIFIILNADKNKVFVMFSLFLAIISCLVFKYNLWKPITLHINLLKVFWEKLGRAPFAASVYISKHYYFFGSIIKFVRQRGRAIRYNLFVAQRQQQKGFPLLSLTLSLNSNLSFISKELNCY